MTPTPRALGLLRRGTALGGFPFTRDTAHTRFTFNGTVAINQVIKELALGPGDRVLMPAYVCGCELGPFEHIGCALDFYNVGADLQLDVDSLRGKLRPGTKAVVITHYFGFPQNHAADIAQLCSVHGAALIEDCAHALFSEDAVGPVGRHGDYAVFSPRKTLPMVDGGVLSSRSQLGDGMPWVSDRPPVLPVIDRLVYGLQQSARCGHERGGALARRCWILALMPVSILNKILRKVLPLSDSDWATADVEGPDAVPFYETRMSSLGLRALVGTDVQIVKATRRKHYMHWVGAFSKIEGCSPLLPTLPPGVCPLYFPVLTDDPAGLVRALAQQHIEAYNWWPHRQPGIDWDHHPHLDALKNHVVALPVHQQLNETAIARIASCIKANLAVGKT